jgi:hypothetical protein
MIFFLVLYMWAGSSIVGKFDTEDECANAAVAYIAMLTEQRSDDKHNAKVVCIGVPSEMPAPAMKGNA